MAPVVHGIEQDYQDRISFVYLDVDDSVVKPLMQEFGFVQRPHFFLVDPEGNIINQWVGMTAGSAIRAGLDDYLALSE